MPFELETPTKARLADVIVLSQKNRLPDDNPGAKLSFEVDLPNRFLSCFDGALIRVLFCKNPSTSGPGSKTKQGTLDGVEPISDLPDLTSIGSKVGVLHWHVESTGYRLVVDQGLGGKRSNLEIDEGTVTHIRMKPKSGGTFQLKFDFESPNVSESAFGKLAKLKSREIEVMILAPEVDQDDIEQDGPFPGAEAGQVVDAELPKTRKTKDPTSAFVDAHSGAAS